jgi:hypothetical protein
VYREQYDSITDAVTHRRDVYFLKKVPEGLAPLLVVVDRMDAKEPHRYEALWHIDSTVLSQVPGRIAFTEMDLVHTAGDAQIITGQEDPVQGFISTGTTGGRRAVPCACTGNNGRQLRTVTVLAPYTASSRRVAAVKACTGIDEEDISVTLEDGTVLHWNEHDLANG